MKKKFIHTFLKLGEGPNPALTPLQPPYPPEGGLGGNRRDRGRGKTEGLASYPPSLPPPNPPPEGGGKEGGLGG
jgi:hypothetical protein